MIKSSPYITVGQEGGGTLRHLQSEVENRAGFWNSAAFRAMRARAGEGLVKMSHFKGLAAAIIGLSSLAGVGQAKADCEDPKNAFDDVYCYSKLYIEADADLNKAYGELTKLLSKDEKATLKKGELGWMRARNAKCSKQEGEDNFVDLDCAVEETRNRISFLQERTQECKASKCQASKLGE
jgi:uncharacterized protein YecT (DUF1311 family)